MRFKPLLLALPLVGSMSACGDLGDDEAPVLATIEGELRHASTAPAPAAASGVRVAIIWQTTGSFRSTHDVDAVPVFPSRFRLELRGAPPREAMLRVSGPTDDASGQEAPTTDNPLRGGDDSEVDTRTRPANDHPQFTYAIGTVVAYEDLNGNGKLDLIDADTPPIDRVLGANDALGIVYIEGAAPSSFLAAAGSPTRGYNLLTRPRCPATPISSQVPQCEEAAWLPISTNYELPLSDDPQLAEMMCGSTVTEHEASATKLPSSFPIGPGPDGWPAKDATGLMCFRDANSYTLTRCESKSKGLCKGTIETCTTEGYRAPDPVPAEWPCSE